jgi:hypothetical protein
VAQGVLNATESASNATEMGVDFGKQFTGVLHVGEKEEGFTGPKMRLRMQDVRDWSALRP